MKCECSLNNNYEVIGLCDIEEFNERISKFKDKSWSQISLPKILKIPDDKPPVKKINKIYLDIKITSTKLIKTPSSKLSNSEGAKLTGKLLLVSGVIYETIIYASEMFCTRTYTQKFNIEFNTHIIVDRNTDIQNTSFCVYPCIEDVSVRILNERTLTKSLTLFLFAHEISNSVEKFDNAFVFETYRIEEMARVEFDKNNKKLIVKSTGDKYGDSIIPEAYKFELLDATGTRLKHSSTIAGNDNADAFRDDLNGKDFQIGDLIRVTFKSNLRIYLDNYPSMGSRYFMISEEKQGFKITDDGIVPYVLLNNIYLENSNDQRIITIRFDILNQSFLVDGSSTNKTNNIGSADYFKVTLYNFDRKIEKRSVSIAGNSNGSAFSKNLNDQNFMFGDILKLSYEERAMVKITNFPTTDTPIYNPKGKEEYFRITPYELEAYIPKPSTLSDIKFVFNSMNNSEMATIKFKPDQDKHKLEVVSTGVNANSQIGNQEYFAFAVRNNVGSILREASVKGNEDANTFRDELNNEFLDEEDIITLRYKEAQKVLMEDYPNMGDTTNPITSQNTYSFKVSKDRLEIRSNLIDNSIVFSNDKQERIAQIWFNISQKTLRVFGLQNVAKPSLGNKEYVGFVLQGPDGTVKSEASIKGNENGVEFENKLSDEPFNYGDMITLRYEDMNTVTLINFPNYKEDTNLSSQVKFDKFRITENGLELIPPTPPPQIIKLQNSFILKNTGDEKIGEVEFDITNMKLIATSTGVIFSGPHTQTHIRFTLVGSDGSDKVFGSVGTGESANDLKNSLNSQSFEFGDSIKIFIINPNIVTLTNYPSTGVDYVVPAFDQKFFSISLTGIAPK